MEPAHGSAAISHSLLGDPDGLLTLRVCGLEHDGRVVRIRAPKCTVGSDASCTLRVRGPGFRSFHCLILRGREGTFVRRLSPDTGLNGCGFDLARIGPHDRLAVGPIELEVLEPTAEPSPDLPIAPAAAAPEPREALQQSLARVEAVERENALLQAQLAEANGRAQKLDLQYKQEMREAEMLIHSMQQEGKHLLAQLEEARQTIHQEIERRRNRRGAGSAERSADEDSGRTPLSAATGRDSNAGRAADPPSGPPADAPPNACATLVISASEPASSEPVAEPAAVPTPAADAAPQPPLVPAPAGVPAEPSPPGEPGAAPDGSCDAEADDAGVIERYMERLLQRVGRAR